MAIRHGRPPRSVHVGALTIESEPRASVKLGGRTLGSTPLRDLSLPVGMHKLLLENARLQLRVVVKVEVREEPRTERFVLRRAGGHWVIARHVTP
jgi:hypothetical protein